MSGFVVDPRTGADVDITSKNLGDITAGLRDGNLEFGADKPVSVIGEDGTIHDINPMDEDGRSFLGSLARGESSGYRLATRAEVRHVDEEKEYGDRGFVAGAAGFARGLTVGLSDRILTDSGVAPETLRGLEEHNKGASMAGEIAGVIAPALVTAGASLEAQAATTAARGASIAREASLAARVAKGAAAVTKYSPAGLVAKAGTMAEQAVAARLGTSAAEGMARRALGTGAKFAASGAVEGGLYGIGDAISESALGREDFTSQSLLAHGMNGVLFGAAGGAALGTGGSLIGQTSSLIATKGGAVTRQARKAVQDLIERGTGTRIADDVADGIVKSSAPTELRKQIGGFAERAAKLHGVDDDLASVARKLAEDPVFNRLATKADDIAEEIAPRLRKTFDELRRISDLVDDEATAKVKRSMFEKSIDVPLSADGKAQAMSLMGELATTADDMIAKPDLYGAQGKRVAKEIKNILGGQAKDIMSGEAGLTVQAAVEQAAAMDSTKRLLGRLQKSSNPNVKGAVEDLYDRIRTHLEDESIYAGGAIAQREVNKPISDFISNDKVFRRQFMTDSGRKSAARPWQNEFVFDSNKAKTWMSRAGTTDGRNLDDLLDQQVTSMESMFTALQKHYDLAPAARETIKTELPRILKQARKDIDLVRQSVGARNQVAALKKATSESLYSSITGSLSPGLTGVLGHMVAGPLGGAAGTAVGAAARIARDPVALARLAGSETMPVALIKLQAATVKAREAIVDAVGGLVGDLPKKVASVAKRVPKTIELMTVRGLTDAYQDRVSQLLTLAQASPEELDNRAAAASLGFEEHAPNTAMAAKEQIKQAANYLVQHIPVASLPDSTVGMPTDTKPRPASPVQMASFLRRAAAVEDPYSVMEDLADGHASPEAVEAVRDMYGAIYQELVNATVMRLRAGNVDYQARRRVGIMLGIQTDPSLDPSIGAAIQAATGSQPQAPSGAAPPPLQMPRREVRLSKSRLEMTETERFFEGISESRG